MSILSSIHLKSEESGGLLTLPKGKRVRGTNCTNLTEAPCLMHLRRGLLGGTKSSKGKAQSRLTSRADALRGIDELDLTLAGVVVQEVGVAVDRGEEARRSEECSEHYHRLPHQGRGHI